MTDYRSMLDKAFLGSWDLPVGRDAVVTIDRVEAGTVTNGTKSQRKPILFMSGLKGPLPKPMVCNATNAKTIAAMYGTHVEEWSGKRIALFVGRASFGGVEMDAIRIRPTIPQSAPKKDEAAK